MLVLSDPVFSREQWCDAQRRRLSCGRGFGGKPPIFLTFAHAKTLFGNSADLLVEFLSIIKSIHSKVINVNIKQFCYVLQTLASIERF